jgi:hypothetical protein
MAANSQLPRNVFVQVKLSLSLINYTSHGDVLGSGDIASSFLTSSLDGGQWSASRPCRVTPGETAPVTHWIGGWVGYGEQNKKFWEERIVYFP